MSNNTTANCAPWPFAFATLPEAAHLHHHAWVDGQAAFAQEVRKMTADWIERRQNGMAASLQAAEAFCGCKDLASLAAVYGTWWSSLMTLAIADFADISGEVSRVIQRGRNTITEISARAAEIIEPEK